MAMLGVHDSGLQADNTVQVGWHGLRVGSCFALFCSFAVSGPCIWNDLPLTLRSLPGTLRQFQSTLKTILFCSAYGT